MQNGDGNVAEKAPAYGIIDKAEYFSQDGLTFLKGLIDGTYPSGPINETMNMRLVEVETGRAVLEGTPGFKHYNPLAIVHGGFPSAILDSAMFCSVQSTLPRGQYAVTLEFKINFVRALTQETGRVRAEGRVLFRGRTTATAEGTLRDAAGKVYAHATTTLMILSRTPESA